MTEVETPKGSFKSLIMGVEHPQQARTTDSLLVDEFIEDTPLTALAYANLIVFLASLCFFAGLDPHSGIGYAFSSFFIIILIVLIGMLALPRLKESLKKQLVYLLIVGFEAALISVLYFNSVAAEPADIRFVIPSIVGMSFVSISLCARFTFPFFFTKVLTILACLIVVYTSPQSSIQLLPFFSIGMVCMMIISAIGYWVIKRKREAVWLRSELGVLNRLADARNLELDEALARAEAAQSLAKENYDLRQQLLTYIGHDLRQPVNAAGFILRELAVNENEPKKIELIQNLNTCVRSVKRMIEDVLQLTHYNNSNIKVSEEAVYINDIFEQLIQEYTELATDKGINIRHVSTGAVVQSDGILVTRIIRNLIQNSIKHANAMTLLLGVRRAGGHIEVWVVDNGRGLPIASQIESCRTKVDSSNLGLGLKISKQLARICGGNLTLVSKTRHGTCARLCFHKAARF